MSGILLATTLSHQTSLNNLCFTLNLFPWFLAFGPNQQSSNAPATVHSTALLCTPKGPAPVQRDPDRLAPA